MYVWLSEQDFFLSSMPCRTISAKMYTLHQISQKICKVYSLIVSLCAQALSWTAQVWRLQWSPPARSWGFVTSTWLSRRTTHGSSMVKTARTRPRSHGTGKGTRTGGVKPSLPEWAKGYVPRGHPTWCFGSCDGGFVPLFGFIVLQWLWINLRF